MSNRKKKAITRPASKQSRGIRRGSQKTVNVVQKKKQAEKHRSATRGVSSAEAQARIHTASKTYPQRKLARVVTEARGLAQRDAVMSTHPGAASRANLLKKRQHDRPELQTLVGIGEAVSTHFSYASASGDC
jgi:hypothetical protein